MKTNRVPVVASIAASIAIVSAVATGVWEARNHAEQQIHDLRDFVVARHDRDADRLVSRLERIESKIDMVGNKRCNCPH